MSKVVTILFFFCFKSISIFDERFSNDIFHSFHTSQNENPYPFYLLAETFTGDPINQRTDASRYANAESSCSGITSACRSRKTAYTVVERTKTWRSVYTAAQYVLLWRHKYNYSLCLSTTLSSPTQPLSNSRYNTPSRFSRTFRTCHVSPNPIACFHKRSAKRYERIRVF